MRLASSKLPGADYGSHQRLVTIPARQPDAVEARELRAIANDAVASAVEKHHGVHMCFHQYDVDVNVLIDENASTWVDVRVGVSELTLFHQLLQVPHQLE